MTSTAILVTTDIAVPEQVAPTIRLVNSGQTMQRANADKLDAKAKGLHACASWAKSVDAA
jgi:hypothetical protein